MRTSPKPAFAPGFRFSAFDAIVLVAGAVAAVALRDGAGEISLTIAFVVGHFFAFCNVFRIARPLELAWSALFAALAASTIVAGKPGWPATITVALIATTAVVLLEMRKASYHGIGWQRINPGLRDWWEVEQGKPGGNSALG